MGEKSSYIHFEDRSGTTYCVDQFPTNDLLRLVRGKISWLEFACIVQYEYERQEEAATWREEA